MDTNHHKNSKYGPYTMLFWMGLLHLPVMYAVMFSMVDTWGDVVNNLNTFYMAMMMVAPMLIMMPLMMMKMYPDKKKNIIVLISSIILFFAAFYGIRQQVLIGDRQFIKSMIPHHSGAILMCEGAKLQDPELKSLCDDIIKAQRSEIKQMERILKKIN